MKTIIMNNNGMSCLVDDADYEWLNQFGWYAWKHPKGTTWYAVRNVVKDDGKITVQRMHKLITGKRQTDHEDGDGMNNQRHNLNFKDSQ